MDIVKEMRPRGGQPQVEEKKKTVTTQTFLQKRIKKEEQMSLVSELVITNINGRSYIKHVYNGV